MKTLIFTDSHISIDSLEELNNIFKEIISYSAERLIMIGDYFHKKNPTTKEILFATRWATEFKKKYKDIIWVRGNHDKIQEISSVDYLKYLDLNVVDDYTDENNNYFGHFMVVGSWQGFEEKISAIMLQNKYNFILLGHQHSFQQFSDKMFHLGSCRFVSWGESRDKNKQIALIDDDSILFIPLHSPIPMIDVVSALELDNIDKMTKVRFIINDFNTLQKIVNQIKNLKEKFISFDIRIDIKLETANREDSFIQEDNIKILLMKKINDEKLDAKVKEIIIAELKKL